MPGPTTVRRDAGVHAVVGVIVSLATALALVGCSSTATPQPPPTPDTSGTASDEPAAYPVPEVGACRSLSAEDVDSAVNTDDPVQCTEEHTAETFAVGQLPARFADAEHDAPGLGGFAYDTCSKAFMRFLGADESRVLRSLLSWAWFRPSEEAWADGARWYRCDVVGHRGEELMTLPETAKGVLRGTGEDRFMACVKGESVPGSPRVPCSDPHDWRAVTTIKLGEEKDPYPGDRVVEVRTRDFCDDSVSAWLGYPLEYTFAYTWFHEAEWNAGNRRSICWAGTDQ